MTMQERITQKLTEFLDPVELEVINESHKHSGHTGDNGSGETHFLVKVVSSRFEGCSVVECHRMVNEILEGEFKGNLHALQISTKCP